MAVAIEDDWQRHGIGRQLVRRLACIAAGRNYRALTAMILPDNRAALGLVHDIAPDASVRWRDGAYRVIVPLAGVC
jgi:GNAT superfamily N-acetyltransferase